MSTNGMTDWAVDLADVSAIYPFQGTEFLLFIAGLVFWIGWHWVQLREEAAELQHELDADETGDLAKASIERY